MPGREVAFIAAVPPAPGERGFVPTPAQREAVKTWALLTGGLVLGVLVLSLAILIIIQRQRRAVMKPIVAKRKKPRTRMDPWAESGKRLPTPDDGSRDDTVDIHPDELGPDDIDGKGPGGAGGADAKPWDGPDSPRSGGRS